MPLIAPGTEKPSEYGLGIANKVMQQSACSYAGKATAGRELAAGLASPRALWRQLQGPAQPHRLADRVLRRLQPGAPLNHPFRVIAMQMNIVTLR